MITTPDLSNLVLTTGAHRSFAEGACLLEAVAYFAGEEFSDRPKCVSALIATFGHRWNDALNDADRQMLVPMIPLLVGTRTTDTDEQTRAFLATDWLVRSNAPAFLEFSGLTEHADALRNLPPITDDASARAANPALDAAESAAWSAAWSAASAATRSAAAWSAAEAARTAAGSAVGSAWSAVELAVGSAVELAVELAVGSAAWLAVELAVGSAAGSALRPTVELLQSSALDLMRRMCEVGRIQSVLEVAL